MNPRKPSEASFSLPRARRSVRGSAFAAGFTLLELLVAVTVLIALSVMLLSITSHVANMWGKAESQNQLRQNARVVMEFLRRDLQQLVFPLESHDKTVFIVQNPSELPLDFLHHDALFWRVPIANTNEGGGLAAIAYFLRKEEVAYTLCRAMITPDQWAGSSLQPDEEDGNEALYSQQPETWVRAAPADKASYYRGLFLKDVLGFWVTAYGRDGIAYIPDSRTDGKRPSLFEISIAFIDKAGITKIEATGSALPDAADNSSVEEYIAELQSNLKAHVNVVKINIPLD